MGPSPGRRKRKHSEEFKAGLVAECRRPGVSLSRVAMMHEINPNLLRRWVNQRGGLNGETSVATAQQTSFVPVSLPTARTPGEICIELDRGETTVRVRWPSDAAEACAAWLRGWLR
jgi:transposase